MAEKPAYLGRDEESGEDRDDQTTSSMKLLCKKHNLDSSFTMNSARHVPTRSIVKNEVQERLNSQGCHNLA